MIRWLVRRIAAAHNEWSIRRTARKLWGADCPTTALGRLELALDEGIVDAQTVVDAIFADVIAGLSIVPVVTD